MKNIVVSPYLMEQKIKSIVKNHYKDSEWSASVRREQKIERLTEEELFLIYQKVQEDEDEEWLIGYLFEGNRAGRENQLSIGKKLTDRLTDRFYQYNGNQIF